MTGPKPTGPRLGSGKWEPVVCPQCGAASPERNPAKAVAWLEAHLAEDHGAEI